MAFARKWRTVLVGVVGFFGGTYSERMKLFKEFEVSAAQPIASPAESVAPMEVDYSSKRVAQIMKFGFPGNDNIRSRKNFVLSYDRRNRIAHWVFEHLTRDGVRYTETVDRSKSEFFEDNSIHSFFRARNSDYRNSGYDRGHLAAAGNHRSSQEFVDDTFVLSNIAPQVGKGFNRDSWNRLEQYVRKLTKKYENIYVCTGPLYLPRVDTDGKKYVKYEVVGANNVAVPTHFFKVIVGESNDGALDLETYVMPNAPIDDNVPLNAFLVPKDSVERAAGLLLFDKISPHSFRYINGMKL